MPPTKVWLNPTCGSGGNVILKNFKLADIANILDIKTELF